MNALVWLALLAAGQPAPAAQPAGGQGKVATPALTAGDVFAFADRAIGERRVDDARALLSALLADPNADVRREANFRLAKLDASGGRMREAAVRYRRILDERPDAQPVRLELASHLARMGDVDAARRELRHARSGNLPPEVAQLVDRFSQALRSSKPFGGSLQLGTNADSNINRATKSDTLGTVIGDFTLDEEAKERSGHGLSIDGQAYYAFPVGQHRLMLTASQSMDLYRHKEFNDVSASLKAGPEFAIEGARLALSAGATRRWFGGERFTDSGTVQVSVAAPLTPSMQGRIGLTAAKVTNHRNRLESGRTYAMGIELEKALSVRTGVGLSLSALRQELRDEGFSTRSAQAAMVGYHNFGRTTLVGSASLGRLVADERLFLYPEKRADWTMRLGMGATFRKIELMGFSPTAQVSWERNMSSIEIYDYRRRALELGVAKAF